MKNIADLLLKTIKTVFKGEEKKNLIISIIKKFTNEELKRDDISFSGNSISLKTNPLLKTEIVLKKKEFLEEINKITESNYTNIQ